MRKNIIVSIWIILVVISCNHLQTNNMNETLIITVDAANYQERMHHSQLFDSVKYIQLESCDDCLIGEIDKIIYLDKHFYILDKRYHTLFAFSETGKLIWKIDSRGNGPGEYRSLIDFDLQNNKLFLLEPRMSVFEYDLSGNFVKQYPIKNIFGNSILVNNGAFYIYTCNYSSPQGDYHLLIMDKYGQKFKNGIPIMQKKIISKCRIFNNNNALFRYNDKIRFFMPFSTIIYSVEEDSVSMPYYFDFKSKNIPENYFNNNTFEDLDNSSYAYGLNSYWENDSYLFFKIKLNERFWDVLYVKNDNNLMYGDFSDDLAWCYPTFQVVNNDYAIGFRSMYDLINEYNYAKSKRKNTILEKIIENSDEEDNPILFIYFFKK